MTKKTITFRVLAVVVFLLAIVRFGAYTSSAVALYPYYGYRGFLYAWPDLLIFIAVSGLASFLVRKGWRPSE